MSTQLTLSTLFLAVICQSNAQIIEWYDVKESDVARSSSAGLQMTLSKDASGNLVMTGENFEFGCHGVCGSHVFAFISDGIDGNPYTKWSKIRYTMQMWGGTSCWTAFGYIGEFCNENIPSDDELNHKGSGLIHFDINTDKVLSNTLLFGAWNGEVVRCDEDPANFWGIVTQGNDQGDQYRGAVTVEQRRDMRKENAGIGSGHSCSYGRQNNKVIFKNIQVGYETPGDCKSGTALDVMFLLDESGSINEDDWNRKIDFVSDIIEDDLNEKSFVSVVKYEGDDEFVQLNPFTQVGGNRDGIVDLLQNQWDENGETNTEQAIIKALGLFPQGETGGANTERENVLFVLTDDVGYSFCTWQLLAAFHNTNVNLVLIGFGEDKDWEGKLKCLYFDPAEQKENLFTIQNYNPLQLDALRLKLRGNKVCQE